MITFSAEMVQVFMDDSKYSAFFRKRFSTQPPEKRFSLCRGIIKQKLSKINCIHDRRLDEYIDWVIDTISEYQLFEMEQSMYPYVLKIYG